MLADWRGVVPAQICASGGMYFRQDETHLWDLDRAGTALFAGVTGPVVACDIACAGIGAAVIFGFHWFHRPRPLAKPRLGRGGAG